MGDVKNVETMLVDLIDVLGMRILDKAHMYEVETEIAKLGVEPFEDEGGVTGVCVLSTSHCAIHTWPLRPFFVMDVYSCRDFDASSVEKLLSERLDAYDLQITDVSEALEYKFAQKAPRLESALPSGVDVVIAAPVPADRPSTASTGASTRSQTAN
jgi:S-adenosylmethionine/arginine decarboxylase-like enzyme